MRYYSAFVLLLISCMYASGQGPTVVSSKNTYYASGEKIKKGDVINLHQQVNVGEKGELKYQYKKSHFLIQPGSYILDSLFTIQKKSVETHDSIKAFLAEKNLVNCKNTIQCRTGMTSDHNSTIETSEDSVLLTWNDFKPAFKGNYFILVSSMFDDYLGLVRTNKKEEWLNLVPFRQERAIIYKIISEDCYQSELMVIKMK